MPPLSKQTRYFLKKALEEDLGSGDQTSRLLIPSGVKAKALIVAKSAGIFCGLPIIYFLCRANGLEISLKRKLEGKAFCKGQTLFIMKGNLHALLAVERTLLNFLARLCGIATLTHQFVQKVKSYGVRILDTRKTTPLWRELEKYAVKIGGGFNHRMGLYDEIFVKENHKTFGNLQKLKKFSGGFVIEVRNRKEVDEAICLKPRVILFDNFSPKKLKMEANYVRNQNPKILLEASGGINLSNIVQYAKTGIDQISIGALTHSVPAMDLSLLVES